MILLQALSDHNEFDHLFPFLVIFDETAKEVKVNPIHIFP